MRLIRSRVSILVATLALAACGGDLELPDPPTMAGTAGSYEAVTFSTSTTAGRVNLLAAGGSVQLVLREDGTTTGTVQFPEGAIPGVAGYSAPLEGSWLLERRDYVQLDFASDVLLDKFSYLIRNDQLLGTYFADGRGYTVTLARR